MFCQNCGTQILGGAAFCTGCGIKVEIKPEIKPNADKPVTEKPSILGCGCSILGYILLIIIGIALFYLGYRLHGRAYTQNTGSSSTRAPASPTANTGTSRSPLNVSFGSVFVYDGMRFEIGNDWYHVHNEWWSSEFKIPVTITNISNGNNSITAVLQTWCPSGLLINGGFESDLYRQIRPGVSLEGYLSIDDNGDGTYELEMGESIFNFETARIDMHVAVVLTFTLSSQNNNFSSGAVGWVVADLSILRLPGHATINVPNTWSFYEGDYYMNIFFIDTNDYIGMSVVRTESEYFTNIIEGNVADYIVQPFIFNDGHVGYMIEFIYGIWWVRTDTWIQITLAHWGDVELITKYENIILQIARSLTLNR
jgi:hypothetical protein